MNTETHVATDHAVQIRGLRKHYPGFDLGPLDLDVPRGSIFGFVGPNGAGKSTTIDLMFGMGCGDAGTVRMLGLDAVADEVAVKTRAAYVGPELEYGSWGKIGNAIRFVRGFYRESHERAGGGAADVARWRRAARASLETRGPSADTLPLT